MSGTVAVAAHGLSMSYGRRRAIEGVSFEVSVGRYAVARAERRR